MAYAGPTWAKVAENEPERKPNPKEHANADRGDAVGHKHTLQLRRGKKK